MRKNCRLLGLLTSLVLTACASGSAIVTGQKRPPITDSESVRILAEMPAGAEQIGVVKASSEGGWTEQNSVDYAVAELKKQAAKIGANAIVLRGHGTTSSYQTEAENVEGVAIYIPPAP